MYRRITPEMHKLLEPSMRKELRARLKDAFEIAVFIADPDLLERTIDEYTDEYLERFKEVAAEKKKNSQMLEDSDAFLEELQHESDDEPRNIVEGPAPKKAPTRRSSRKRPKRTTGKRTSKYTGVSLTKSSGLYRARLSLKGKVTEIGMFEDETDAAKAYDRTRYKATRSTVGLNFPEDYRR